MANPLIPGNPQNGGNLLQQFLAFKNSFKGDPKATVEGLLKSGQMSQEQFNKLQSMATNLQNVLH